MKRIRETENEYKSKLMKQFIVDVLNSIFFGSMIYFDGIDQYNQLPIIRCDEEDKKHRTEQRGVLLMHSSLPIARRMLITVSVGLRNQICYRICDIQEPIEIDDPKRTCVPSKSRLDLSISDTDVGSELDSSYIFSDNTSKDGTISISRLANLIKFILDSILITVDNSVFEDLMVDTISFPPVPGDPHYHPVHIVRNG